MVFAICIATLTNFSFGQMSRDLGSTTKNASVETAAMAFAPTPVTFPGRGPGGSPSCSSLSQDPRFPRITSGAEFKIDTLPAIGSSNFPLVNNPNIPTIVSGGLNEDPRLSITTVLSSNTVMDRWSLNWTEAAALVVRVSAVIVKGGSGGANVYYYPDFSVGDIGPFVTPTEINAISHISFCFEPTTAPSSAPVSIAGRALTPHGYGVSGARIEVMNLSTGEVMTAITNPFGFYAFKGINSEVTYLVTASHKRHQFIDSQRTLTINEDLVGLDFVSAW